MTHRSGRLKHLLKDFIDEDDDFVLVPASQNFVWDDEQIASETYERGQQQLTREGSLHRQYACMTILVVVAGALFSYFGLRADLKSGKQESKPSPRVAATTSEPPPTVLNSAEFRETAGSPIPHLVPDLADEIRATSREVAAACATQQIETSERAAETLQNGSKEPPNGSPKQFNDSTDKQNILGIAPVLSNANEISAVSGDKELIPDRTSGDIVVSSGSGNISIVTTDERQLQIKTAQEAEQLAVDVQVAQTVFMQHGLDPNLASVWAMRRQISKLSDETRAQLEVCKLNVGALQREQDSRVAERRHQETLSTMQYPTNWLENLDRACNRCYNGSVFGFITSTILSCVGEVVRQGSTLLQEKGSLFQMMLAMVSDQSSDGSIHDTSDTQVGTVSFWWFSQQDIAWSSFLPFSITHVRLFRLAIYIGSAWLLHKVCQAFLVPKYFHHVVNGVLICSFFPHWISLLGGSELMGVIIPLVVRHAVFQALVVVGVWRFHLRSKHSLEVKGHFLGNQDLDKQLSAYENIYWAVLAGPILVSLVYIREIWEVMKL